MMSHNNFEKMEFYRIRIYPKTREIKVEANTYVRF